MRARGLTLIEVLVALVVCTAGLVVVSGAISQCLLVDGRAGEMEQAADLMEVLLAQLGSGELELSSQSGDFADQGYAEVRWALQVDPGQLEGLVETTCTVSWTTPAGDRSFEVQRSFFLDPLAGGALR
ncbi:MAG: prepilin-type N-terminal cleavage/methylation domain-containing protein [Planctomycetota bacterium]